MVTRRPSSADRMAASTIARLKTLLCTSPEGMRPVRTASTNSAREPAISSGSVPGSATMTVPSAAWAAGAPSPSQVAEPPAPLTRQLPFQEVSSPGLHQLPLKLNTAPPTNSKVTCAVASPANQLQLGLADVQNTATGSLPTRSRARSNWWMAMSTSRGYGISSRKPGKCAALKKVHWTTPTGAMAAICRRKAVSCRK